MHQACVNELRGHKHIEVPEEVERGFKSTDSLQFRLVGLSDKQVEGFIDTCRKDGLQVSVFG